RSQFGFPGMRILQFAFDSKESGGLNAANHFLPHNYDPNTVVYTGTHDNDTTRGWYRERTLEEKDFIRRYLARPDDDIVWYFIRLAMASVAVYAIIPFQDVLVLDSDARMNRPAILGGNWAWRYRTEALNEWSTSQLRELVDLYGRDPQLWAEREEKEIMVEEDV
ncbi:MAG: 4-alpha-glucanotransferase, partial [Chloroflexota bacterium]